MAEDGAVTLIDVISRDRTPTGIVVDPNVESIAYVDGKVVTYNEDRLSALEIDGTVIWEATYPASPTDVEVFPLGIDLPTFALTKLGSGASAVDVRTGTVLWTSTMSSTGIAFSVADGLYAVALDSPDASSGLLEFGTGSLVVTDGVRGSVHPTAVRARLHRTHCSNGDRTHDLVPQQRNAHQLRRDAIERFRVNVDRRCLSPDNARLRGHCNSSVRDPRVRPPRTHGCADRQLRAGRPPVIVMVVPGITGQPAV